MKKHYKLEFDLEKPDEALAYETYSNLARGIPKLVFLEALLSIKDVDPREVKRHIYRENFGLKAKLDNRYSEERIAKTLEQSISIPPQPKRKKSKLFQ